MGSRQNKWEIKYLKYKNKYNEYKNMVGGDDIDEKRIKLIDSLNNCNKILQELDSLTTSVFGTAFDASGDPVTSFPSDKKGITTPENYINKLIKAYDGKLLLDITLPNLFEGLDKIKDTTLLDSFISNVKKVFDLNKPEKKRGKINKILQNLKTNFNATLTGEIANEQDTDIRAVLLEDLDGDIDIDVNNFKLLINDDIVDDLDNKLKDSLGKIEKSQKNQKQGNTELLQQQIVIKKKVSARTTIIDSFVEIIDVIKKEIADVLSKISEWNQDVLLLHGNEFKDNQQVSEALTQIDTTLVQVQTSVNETQAKLFSGSNNVSRLITELKDLNTEITEELTEVRNKELSTEQVSSMTAEIVANNTEATDKLIALIKIFNDTCDEVNSTAIDENHIDEIVSLCKIINAPSEVGKSWKEISKNYKMIKNIFDNIKVITDSLAKKAAKDKKREESNKVAEEEAAKEKEEADRKAAEAATQRQAKLDEIKSKAEAEKAAKQAVAEAKALAEREAAAAKELADKAAADAKAASDAEAARVAAAASAPPPVVPEAPKAAAVVGAEATKISTADALTPEQIAANLKKLQGGSCVNEFIRIRPFLAINDERATELQLSLAKPTPIKYDPARYKLFQNKTNMVTGNYCIDFTRVFFPLEPGKDTTSLDKDGKETKVTMTLEKILDSKGETDKFATDSTLKPLAETFVQKTNTAFKQLIPSPFDKTPPTKLKAGVTGGIFNDMDSFMDANRAAYESTTATGAMKSKDNTGFINRKNVSKPGTWENVANNQIQSKFAAAMKPVTTDRFFSDDAAINKNVLIMFYGASGSGKTHSMEAILIDLFKNIVENISKPQKDASGASVPNKGYGISVFSDYNNYIYDYFSEAADNRYYGKGSSYTSQYFSTGKNEKELMNDLLGNDNNLKVYLGKETAKPKNPNSDAIEKDFLRMVKADCMYRATSGRSERKLIKKIGTPAPKVTCKGVTPPEMACTVENTNDKVEIPIKDLYFCEGLPQFAISPEPVSSISFESYSSTQNKYLKYKTKYLELKSILNGGSRPATAKSGTAPAKSGTAPGKGIKPIKMLMMTDESTIISSFTEIRNRIKLFRGVNDTGLNAESSRSHLIIRVCNLNKSENIGGYTFTVIDLAGTENLNFLLNKESRQVLLGPKEASTPDWASIEPTLIKENILNISASGEGGKTKLQFVNELVKVKTLALYVQEKYNWIEIKQTDPNFVLDVNMLNEDTPEGGANKINWDKAVQEKLKEQGFDVIPMEPTGPWKTKIQALIGQVLMLQQESTHINNSLDSIRKILADSRIKDAKPNCSDDKYKKNNKFISIVAGVLCPIMASGATSIVVIGALNPRRADDFNSYSTMTKIVGDDKMALVCPTEQTACV
jgi:hypothetical protein